LVNKSTEATMRFEELKTLKLLLKAGEEETKEDFRKKNNTEFLDAVDEFLTFNREFLP